jgi:hypothetical protein
VLPVKATTGRGVVYVVDVGGREVSIVVADGSLAAIAPRD